MVNFQHHDIYFFLQIKPYHATECIYFGYNNLLPKDLFKQNVLWYISRFFLWQSHKVMKLNYIYFLFKLYQEFVIPKIKVVFGTVCICKTKQFFFLLDGRIINLLYRKVYFTRTESYHYCLTKTTTKHQQQQQKWFYGASGIPYIFIHLRKCLHSESRLEMSSDYRQNTAISD